MTFEKFSEEFKNDFVNLNLAWLRESFAVEPHDVAVLERCEVRSEFQGYFVGIFCTLATYAQAGGMLVG